MYTFTSSLLAPGITRSSVFSEIKEGLESRDRKKIMQAFHALSRSKIPAKQKAKIFPKAVSLILHELLEIKSAAYSFVLRSIEIDRTLLLLVVNTVLREINACEDGNTPSASLRKSLAIDFVAKIEDKEFLGHFCDEIEKGMEGGAEIVKKSALLAAPVLCKVFKEARIQELKQGLRDGRPSIVGSAISSMVQIERIRKNSFDSEELARALVILCSKRAEIEEACGSFGYLFSSLCRLLRPFSRKEVFESVLYVIPYLPPFALRELLLSGAPLMSPTVAERIGASLTSYLGTEHRVDALEILRVLFQSLRIKVDVSPYLIDGSDGRREKLLKLDILASISDPQALHEIRTYLKDRDCSYTSLCILVRGGHVQESDVVTGMKYALPATLRALYKEHPLPEQLSDMLSQRLKYLSNVSEKEAYLYLAGYYLSSIPDEAKRIKRIRNSAGGILYGKKEERERSEEHLEEYMYFLLNFYLRKIIGKEECIRQANEAFADEEFLLSKFNHLIGLSDTEHLSSLVAYKRVSYKMDER